MESVLIFGGGLNQLTLIRSAKELGYKTIVIDPLQNAPAKEIAHHFEVVAPKDYERTKEIARQYDVRGIVTCQMENPLLLMAKLSGELGFIFPSEEAISSARNKYLMKQCFLTHKVPCAKGVLIKEGEKITKTLCDQITFPLIIKPVDSFSSRGVYKIRSFEEIEKYEKATRQFSSNGDILIEEFLDGPEVSVEAVCQNHITTVVQVTDKVITPYPMAVELEHSQPSGIGDKQRKDIESTIEQAVTALGLDNCGIHAEFKITSNGIKIVEVGARLGGDYITSHLVPFSTGVNIEKAIIQIAMGKKAELEPKFKRGSAVSYLTLPSGQHITKIENWNDLMKDARVKDIYVFVKEGDTVPEVTDSAKRSACVIVQDVDRASAQNTAKEVVSSLEKKIQMDNSSAPAAKTPKDFHH